MTDDHERRRKPARVAEPVQVYLERPDQERLARLAERLDATKSDVLRRGLEALEAQLRHSRDRGAKDRRLPVFRGGRLMPGVDLDNSAALIDLMERDDTG